MYVSYAQICILDGTLENPFNDWTERHVKQGFAWRDGSVSFRTLIEDGLVSVEFLCSNRFTSDRRAQRAITVPFVCRRHSSIEIATITESQPVDLAPGVYQLVFETGIDGKTCWCRFTVVLGGDQMPRVLIQDSDLEPPFPLLMSANPAQ